ncbi:MAG: hypothetical protein ACXWQQ_04325 [Pseudobdellovibrio sp.]
MTTFFSPYTLKRTDIEAKQDGCLIKLEQDGFWGVADLSPHPELGDSDYLTEIKNKGPLYRHALSLAQEDLSARRDQVSLLQDKPVSNNYLITNFEKSDFNEARFEDKTLKIKGTKNISGLAEKINSIEVNTKLRLDFNSKLNAEEFEKFLSLLNEKSFSFIEYIEDPTCMTEQWKTWNQKVKLAYDFQSKPYNPDWAAVKIIKPARQAMIGGLKHFTLTSAMDHPVGVAHGLRIAQKLSQNESGFLTLDLFEETVFNKYYRQNENFLNFSKSALNDTGIGMTGELSQLKWLT